MSADYESSTLIHHDRMMELERRNQTSVISIVTYIFIERYRGSPFCNHDKYDMSTHDTHVDTP